MICITIQPSRCWQELIWLRHLFPSLIWKEHGPRPDSMTLFFLSNTLLFRRNTFDQDDSTPQRLNRRHDTEMPVTNPARSQPPYAHSTKENESACCPEGYFSLLLSPKYKKTGFFSTAHFRRGTPGRLQGGGKQLTCCLQTGTPAIRNLSDPVLRNTNEPLCFTQLSKEERVTAASFTGTVAQGETSTFRTQVFGRFSGELNKRLKLWIGSHDSLGVRERGGERKLNNMGLLIQHGQT